MLTGKLLGTSCVLLGLTSMQASADTVGLWLFDDVVDLTPPAGDPPVDPPGGEIFYDETPNAFHFNTTTNFGTFISTPDRPSVIPSGQALISQAGGASLPSTPSSTQFSRGKTGALTIEFWYQYTSPPPGEGNVGYVLSFGGASAATRNNEWGIYGTSAGELKFFDYENGNTGPYPEVGTGVLDADWHHIAFTVDGTNSMKSYVDGVQIGTNTAAPLFSTLGTGVNDVLKWGRSHQDGFANHIFRIDELRISNTALLPGNGSGNNELAWNASLAPAVLLGDFNLDTFVNATDIDMLVAEIAGNGSNSLYDVNEDASVTSADLNFMIATILETNFGDTDLDQDVDLNDLSNLAANYGASPRGWAQGNFDTDTDVDLNDLSNLAAYYGQGSAQAFADFQAVSVPEPLGASTLAIGAGWALVRRRRSCR